MFATPKRKKSHGIILTSMIDILFLLVIFFMLSSDFSKQRAISIATSKQNSDITYGPRDEKSLIMVMPYGDFIYQNRGFTAEQAPEFFAQMAKDMPGVGVKLHVYSDTKVQDLMNFMEIIKNEGIYDVEL